jgi:hypothetical protein
MIVVITIVTVMLGLCAGMIHLLLKLDRAGRTSSDLAADLARLARDFRADAHAASTVEPAGQPLSSIKLTLEAGKTVEYLVRPSDLLRTLREGDKVRHYDVYRRPPKSAVSIELTREGSTTFAGLVIDRPPNGVDDSLYSNLRIEAEIDKDRRLTRRSE